MHGFGARSVRGVNTLDQCQTACESDSSCLAIDYDPANRRANYCWLLRRSYRIGPSRGVTHYVLDRNCTGTTAAISIVALHIPLFRQL